MVTLIMRSGHLHRQLIEMMTMDGHDNEARFLTNIIILNSEIKKNKLM
jgi:hypothetical protein